MLYTSINNQKIKELKKLEKKKHRDETNMFLIETEHLVKEAYASGILKEILLLEGTDIDIDIPKNYVNDTVLKHLSQLPSPSNIIGICHKKEEKLIGNKILVLDDVQDPGNVGTIIRSSVAFNVDTIVLSGGSADIYSDKVLRASQGMIFKMNFFRGNIKEIIASLKDKDYKIYGSKVTGGKPIKNVTKSEKSVIIMGNEGNGISEEILKMCDEYIYIPISENCESLNVGVAAGIILYEL